ncbi:MAG: hypothetical protein VX619_08830 [bacterium]|nr:hypothetical protein [bacterium]
MIKIFIYLFLVILVDQQNFGQVTYQDTTLGQARHFQSLLRTNFYGVDRNPNKSYQLFIKAAKQGDADAAYNLGYMSYRGDGVAVSKSEALKWWTQASESGHLAATYQLAHLLKHGSPEERVKSCNLFESAVKSGLKAAYFEAGLCRLDNSSADACELFKLSHEAGFPEGTYNYAWCIHKAMPKKSLELLYEAFNNGLNQASAAIYKLSNNETLEVLQQAAESNSSKAHFLIYSHHKSQSESSEAGISNLRQAAKLGNIDAQFELGQLHYDSQINESSHEDSFYWWNKAALGGHTQAQFNLGHSYLTGRGVKKDIVLAASWFNLASRQDEKYKAHLYIEKLLTQKEKKQLAQLLEEGLAGFNEKRQKQLALVVGKSAKETLKPPPKKVTKDGSETLDKLFETNPSLAVTKSIALAKKGDGIAQLRLGRYYRKQKQLEEAIKWLLEAQKTQPDSVLELGQVYLAMKKPQKVLDLLASDSGTKTLEIRLKALQMQGDMLYLNFKNVEAQKLYLQLEQLHPDKNNFDLLSRLARIHDSIGLDMFAEGQKAQAENILKKSLEYTEKLKTHHPERAETYLLLAVSTGNLARFKSGKDKIRIGGAVEGYCQKAIELNPNLGRPYSILATYYWEISKLSWILKAFARSFLGKLPEKSRDDALQLYRTSLENNPNQIYGQYKMADLLIAMNRKDEAKNHLRMALKLKALSTGDQRVQKDAKELLKKIGG